MSQLKTRVGGHEFQWKKFPQGPEGTIQVQISSDEWTTIQWKRDQDGIWVVMPHGIFGFDLHHSVDDSGGRVFHLAQRNSELEWNNLKPAFGNEAASQVQDGARVRTVRVRAQMPGKIVKLLVEANQLVEKDQPIIVMEAMKMENEIRAPQAGKISQVFVNQGQAVESGANLLVIEPVTLVSGS